MKLSDFEITEAYNGVDARLTKLTTDLTRNWQNSKNLAKAQYPDIDTNPQTQAAVLKNWLKTRLKVGDVDLTATDPAALISQGASKYLQNQLGLSMDAGPQAQPQAQPQANQIPKGELRTVGGQQYQWQGAQWAKFNTANGRAGQIATKQVAAQLAAASPDGTAPIAAPAAKPAAGGPTPAPGTPSPAGTPTPAPAGGPTPTPAGGPTPASGAPVGSPATAPQPITVGTGKNKERIMPNDPRYAALAAAANRANAGQATPAANAPAGSPAPAGNTASTAGGFKRDVSNLQQQPGPGGFKRDVSNLQQQPAAGGTDYASVSKQVSGLSPDQKRALLAHLKQPAAPAAPPTS